MISDKKKIFTELEDSAYSGNREMEASVTIIKEVANSSRNILEMLEVINSIVDNTELLAMNAAIEAAHAGEYGKGFSVVADEIRKLAETTSRKSSEIDKTIKSIIASIDSSAQSIERTTNIFATIVEKSNLVFKSINEIDDVTQEVINKTNTLIENIIKLSDISTKVSISTKGMQNQTNEIKDSASTLKNVSSGAKHDIEEILASIDEILHLLDKINSIERKNRDMIDSMEVLVNKFQ